MRKHHFSLYQSGWHLAVTFAVIVIPFIYLLVFAYLSRVDRANLYQALLVSAGRMLVAYLIAVIIAWVCAVAFYRGRRSVVALPLFDVLQSFPTFAALPLAVLAFGQDNVTVIFFLVLTIIWPIFFSIISALKRINREWYEVVEMADLLPWQYLRRFLLPITIPGLITGSIIGLGEGWEALIATEMIAHVRTGLGQFFISVTNSPTITAFGILGLLLFIFSLNKLIWLPLLERSHHRMEEA